MKKETKHMEPDHLSEKAEKMIAGSKIHWDKSREQIWMELGKKIEAEAEVEVEVEVEAEHEPIKRSVTLYKPWIRNAVAAGFALLIGISALVMYYTKTIEVPAGQHAEIFLPDGSEVKVNAQSGLSYKPLRWKMERSVKLEGEAYFSVKKGKRFEVISDKGKTAVMGTTFNIYSREDDYQVTCFTGKVKVLGAMNNQEVILSPGQRAVIKENGSLVTETGIDTDQYLLWLDNKLSFTSVPLKKVFEEISRQYGVLIAVPEDLDYKYTGTFVKDSQVENVLNLVCRPFDLKTTRKTDNEYVITKEK